MDDIEDEPDYDHPTDLLDFTDAFKSPETPTVKDTQSTP
jgi:hypothetical protein